MMVDKLGRDYRARKPEWKLESCKHSRPVDGAMGTAAEEMFELHLSLQTRKFDTEILWFLPHKHY